MDEAKRRAERRQDALDAGKAFAPQYADGRQYRTVVWNIDRSVYDPLVEQYTWFLTRGQGSPSLEEFAVMMLTTAVDEFAAAREAEAQRQAPAPLVQTATHVPTGPAEAAARLQAIMAGPPRG